MLVNMKDKTKTGTLDIQEWGELWDYLLFWKHKFDSVDRDGGGTVGFNEFMNLMAHHTPFKTIMTTESIHSMSRLVFDRFDYSRLVMTDESLSIFSFYSNQKLPL